MFTFRKSTFFIVFLALLFIIKGIVLSLLIPPFQNPDEQIHYGTVQYWAESARESRVLQAPNHETVDSADIATYGLSEEIIQTAQMSQFDEIKFSQQNIPYFQISSEDLITQNHWRRYLDTTLKSVSGTRSVFYLLASWSERFFADQTIFTRIFLARMLALLFGVGVIALAYLTARKIGLSENISLLFMTLVAFQPMLSVTAAQINIDIALIFSFSLFLYSGICLLKTSFRWKHVFLSAFSAILGFFSKGPGIILVVALYPLFIHSLHKKLALPKRKSVILFGTTTCLLVLGIALIVPTSYFINITNFSTQSKFSSPLSSLEKYFDKTMTSGELRDTALSYWGHFGWLDHTIPDWSLSLILIISAIGFAGTLWYLFSDKDIPHLPKRRFLVFFLGMMIALQLAIRFYDWRVFDYTGKILIGQPGRYFLPNLIGHLVIIVTGLGFLLRQEERLFLALKILTFALVLLQLHAIVNIILPRYYL